MLLWIKIDLVRIGTMRVQIKIWSVLDAILQMILYRVVIYSSLVEQRGRGEMCVWLFRHEMEGYLLYRNAITSLFAWFYAEDRLQSPSWPLNLAHLWEEQVGRTYDNIWSCQHNILSLIAVFQVKSSRSPCLSFLLLQSYPKCRRLYLGRSLRGELTTCYNGSLFIAST